MSSRSGRRSRSRSRNRDSRRSSRKETGRPWVKKSRSSSSSSSSSRSRSSRRKNRRSRSRSRSPVRPVMSKDPKYVNARVFVANFASNKASNIDMHKIFEKHGKIVDVLVHHNGYGFVQFANVEDAKKAIESETGTVFHGKTLKCKMAVEGKKENEEEQRGGGDRGGERGGGPPVDNGVGRGGGPGFPPPDDRFGRDNRDPFGPPRGGDPFMRGRELPPPPMDYRGLPGPYPRDSRDFRDLPPDYPLPPRGFRDLQRELPPRDPIFDDPYRRPPPPDLYYDRLRDDPYRRDPYRLDPYRDPYRDPFGPSLLEPVAAPKKALAVDCEIIVMSSELRRYADVVEKRLKNMNLLTSVAVIREDQTIQQQVEEAATRSCLFAITINSQNELHRSLTVNILHGVTQEHRNMPLDDAVELVGRSFEKFLTAEKEKLAAKTNKEKSPGGEGERKDEGGSGGSPHPKDIGTLLTLLVDNQALSVEELDRLLAYLQDRRDKVLGRVRTPHPADRDGTESPGLQQSQPQVQNQQQPPPPPQYQQEPQYQQPQQQQSQYQQPQQQQSQYQQPQQQQPQYQQPQQQQSQYQQPQQQQSQYQQPQQQYQQPQQHYQEPPQPSPYHQTQPQPSFQPQQQQSPSSTTQDLRTKILDIMNGTSTAPTNSSLPLNTLTSHTTPLLPATVTARPPPPPPPPPQQSPTPDSSAGVKSSGSLGSYHVASSLGPGAVTRGASCGMMTTSPAGAALRGASSSLAVSPSVPGVVPRSAASVASSSGSLVSGIPATLINFDNPTVQKALDNLIQSGPSLFKTISATAGQGLALATAQQPGGFRGAGRPPQPPR